MSEETYRPLKVVGLTLAGLVVLAGVLMSLGVAIYWYRLIPGLVIFALGVLARPFATVEVRLLDGIAALAFGIVLVMLAMSHSLYGVCAPLAVAAVAVAATRLVR